jgi:DNA-directed DNA polymerase III PolC
VAADVIPQLRVRTEFSFKERRDCAAFGPVALVAGALKELGSPGAGIVDGGTWGHVRWLKAMQKVGLKPFFGTELTFLQPDGRKPSAWALAEDTRQFYRFSTAARQPGADLTQLFATSKGIIRFAGAALTDPETFDYVDLNPASPLQQRAAVALARHTGKPLVVTSDNAYPRKQDFSAFMIVSGRQKVTQQHLLTVEELRASMPMVDDETFVEAVRNTHEAAERCATTLPTAPLIHFDGDLVALARAGQERRLRLGHIEAWTPEYEARLVRELKAIAEKAFESYFLVVSDLISWAKERMLVGPGRGSSAGSLLCYLIGITEVDPLVHKLLFERFIDLTRKDLPDIDIDFSDRRRELCFDYLAQRYGRDNVARIGNVNTMKPRTVLERIGRSFAIPKDETDRFANVLIEYSSGDSRYGKSLEDTLNTTHYGKLFMERYPQAALMSQIENHASHSGVHAAGVIVSNEPVNEYCTVGEDGVAHIDKPDSEHLNLLKIDALGLSTLGIIEDAGVVTADELYALKLNDPEVLEVFNSGKLCGVFQFEGHSQRRVTRQIHVKSFEQVDHITALARPGPLGGGAMARYGALAAGAEAESKPHDKFIAPMVGDTHGVVLYQEQVMRIVSEIGKFSWEQTTAIRKAMSGRKGKEYFDQQSVQFVKGAAEDGISEEDARAIWDEICSFGAWGMNKSHTCAYGIIAYWCAWMKRYHPLEYAAAVLRHEDDENKVLRYLRELANSGVEIVPIDPDSSDENWSAKDGKLYGGFRNLKGFGPVKAAKAVQARQAGTMTDSVRAQIAKAHNKFGVLYPITTTYRGLYEDPESRGVASGWSVSLIKDIPPNSEAVFIGKVVKKEMRDENETVRVAKRGGKLKDGQTLFTDLFITDDSDEDMICRLRTKDFDRLGRPAFERLKEGQDVVMIRGRRYLDSTVVFVDRIRCLTRPEVFE